MKGTDLAEVALIATKAALHAADGREDATGLALAAMVFAAAEVAAGVMTVNARELGQEVKPAQMVHLVGDFAQVLADRVKAMSTAPVPEPSN